MARCTATKRKNFGLKKRINIKVVFLSFLCSGFLCKKLVFVFFFFADVTTSVERADAVVAHVLSVNVP